LLIGWHPGLHQALQAGRDEGQMDMHEGTVVWFNNAKGYGFLSQESGPDVFVHFSSIQRDGYKSLKEGQRVRYRIGDSQKGPQAEDVVLVDGEPLPESGGEA